MTWFEQTKTSPYLLLILVTLTVGFVLLTTSCSLNSQREFQERHLRIAIPDDIETIDPPFSHFQVSNEVNYNIYDPFFVYGTEDSGSGYHVYDPQKILGSAVESWRTSPDGQTVVLGLRQGAKFARTGRPVTAEDFIYWFDRAKALKAGTWFNVESSDIDGWSKTGDYEVTLHFRKPNPFFFRLFRDQSQAPMEKTVLAEHVENADSWSTRWAARNDAGSGAFYVERWVPGVEMTLRANPFYERPVFFQRVTLYVVPSPAGRSLLLARGAVDIAEQLSTIEIKNLRNVRGVRIISVPSRDQFLVGLNNSRTPFTSRLVRQALAYAVPYETIVRDVFEGQAVQSRSPIPVKGQFHDSTLWPYRTDIPKARELLSQAGFPHGFSFALAVPTADSTAMELAVVLQNSFKQAGVTMTINPETAAVFAERLDKRSHQAWLRDLLLYVDDPGYMGTINYRSGAILNWMAYSNPEVDRVFDQINLLWRPQDQESKAQLCKQMQKLVIEDSPVLFLGEPNFNLAVRNDITGYVHQPDNLLTYAPLRRQ